MNKLEYKDYNIDLLSLNYLLYLDPLNPSYQQISPSYMKKNQKEEPRNLDKRRRKTNKKLEDPKKPNKKHEETTNLDLSNPNHSAQTKSRQRQ